MGSLRLSVEYPHYGNVQVGLATSNLFLPMTESSLRTSGEPRSRVATPSGVAGRSDNPAPSLPGVAMVGTRSRIPKVGYVYDIRMMGHAKYMDPNDMNDEDEDDAGDRHPEQPRRIQRIDQKLQDSGCLQLMSRLQIRPMLKHEALLVHSEDHWQKVAAIEFMDLDSILNSQTYYEHLSLYVHPKTPEAALLSAGGVIEASLAVALGRTKTSFANVRPPGHHAEPEEHMGFCFFNNVAIAARVVQQETPLKKILILDWDVHHGNGTQRAFYDDPSILYISIHRFDGGNFYPTGPYGSMESCGEGEGLGTSVNIPWPTNGMTDADYLYAFMRIVMPIAYEFAPELVIISAGFDAADGDTLGECHVTPAGYAHMTHMLSSLANGKVVVALEGGYNLNSISASAVAVAEVLLGNPPPMMSEQQASEVATETVWQVSRVQSRFWTSINPKQCEPKEDYGDDAIPLPDILKAYRLDRMIDFGVYAILLPDNGLAEAFEKQVLCSTDFYQRERLIVFIHDYGSLRAEPEGVTHIDMDLESAYILDATQSLTSWVVEEEFALMDVNVFPHKLKKGEREEDILKQLVVYLWDNYIELSDAKDVVLVATGYSCRVLGHLLTNRPVDQKVRAIVQVVGSLEPTKIPISEPNMRRWYIQNNLVIVSEDNPIRSNIKFKNSSGIIETAAAERPSKVFKEALPKIQRFIRNKLNMPEPIVEERGASLMMNTNGQSRK